MRRASRLLLPVCLLTLGLALAGCGGCDNGNGDAPDADTTATCGGVACDPGTVCRYDTCVADPPPCVDGACDGDAWCDPATNECLPWGVGPSGDHDEACVREAVPGVFVPGVQCEWLGPSATDPYPDHKNVLGSPMVVDFGLAGSGSEFSNPYIVLISYNYTDGGAESCQGTNPAYFGVVRILDGRTCDLLYTIDAPTVVAAPSVALGDLDGDGRAEIVAARTQGGLVAWRFDTTDDAWKIYWETTSVFADTLCDWAGPSIYDLDDDGQPEVVFYGSVYDGQDGTALDEALVPTDLEPRTTGYIPVVADVDADGLPELVTGKQLYAWDIGNTAWVPDGPALGATGGRVAVADFGTFGADPGQDDRATLDGVAEVAYVNLGVLHVWSIAGREIFAGNLQGATPGNGGPPTIADFDGDGRVEVAVAGATAYTVFDYDCQAGGTSDVCGSGRTDYVLWSQPSQDASSNVTGSSVFDFEGDGRAEVVYADECFTRVYDGVTGKVMYSRYRTSCTWYELPIVADVDGDFNAEIVVGSNTNCNVSCPTLDPIFDGVSCVDDADCPGTTTCGRDDAGDTLGRCRCGADADCGGDNFVCRDPIAGPSAVGQVCRAEHAGPATASGIRVISDQLDRWVNTRRIWNQHAYSVTNVEENGRIPRTSEWLRNWDVPGLNTFRQNAPGAGIGDGLVPTPDLTVRSTKVTCEGADVTISAEVCNRGTEPVAPGVPVSLYESGGAVASCTTQTSEVMYPGVCTMVDCTFAAGDGTVTVVVDDDGTGQGANTECREGNNRLDATVACP
ncbi:MAG: hypothetical protein H6708_14105 [Kofleriaceae bacterium]|nr:hypothetical protein [Kofleriaceae bacterium]